MLRVGGFAHAEFKFAQIQNSHVEGSSQNLMLSSNLLKSKIPILWVGGGSCNLMLSSNLLKSKIPMLRVGGLIEFDVELKFAKIQNSHVGGRGACRI